MQMLRLLIVMVVFALAVPTVALSQDAASEDYFNAAAANGTMNLTIVAAGVNNVKTAPGFPVNLVAGDSANTVARKAWLGICQAASAIAAAGGMNCTVSTFPVQVLPPNTCPSIAGDDLFIISCTGTTSGRGFTLQRSSTQIKIDLTPAQTAGSPPGNVQNLNCTTSVMDHGSDLLDREALQVQPNGVLQGVTFEVTTPPPGNNVVSFSLTPQTGETSSQWHNRIATGFRNMTVGPNNLGLIALVIDGSEAAKFSGAPETFASGSFILIPNAKEKVAKIHVDGAVGQTITTETGDTGSPLPPPPVPALNPWGVAILVVLMLVSGLWMLRRRQAGSHVA